MTGDQNLINKIEKVEAALGSDQVLAAYHMLDELIREVETAARESLQVQEPAGQMVERFPALAVG